MPLIKEKIYKIIPVILFSFIVAGCMPVVSYADEVTAITITNPIDYVPVGDHYIYYLNFTTTGPYADKSTTWSSSSSSVVAVDCGTITPLVAGRTTRITVASSVNPEIMATTYVTGAYVVNFEANGGTGTTDRVTSTTQQVTLPNCTFTPPSGYEFDCWTDGYADYAAGTDIGVYTSITTLQAKWKEKTEFTYTFDPNGGSGTMSSVTLAKHSSYTLPECTFTPPSADYTFGGWTFNGYTMDPGTKVYVSCDLTIKAVWKERCTVSFDGNGGTGSMSSIPVLKDTYCMLPACEFTAPSKKQFSCWMVNDAKTKNPGDSVLIDGNTVIKAIWEDIPVTTCTITFDGNGGTGAMDSVTVNKGSSYTLPYCNFTAPSGKHFICWGIHDGDVGYPGDVRSITSAITLKAMWEEDDPTPPSPPAEDEFTVTYDLDGHGTNFITIVASGSNAPKPDNPTCTGWSFIGWCVDAARTIAYDFKTKILENTIIYAKWEEEKKPTPSSSDDNDEPAKPTKTGTWNDPVTNGTWSCDTSGRWTYRTNALFRSTWGYIRYTDQSGKVQTGWFFFDSNGYMLTGWIKVNGKYYYLNKEHDGTYGMCLLDTTTPDGYKVDASGAWIE